MRGGTEGTADEGPVEDLDPVDENEPYPPDEDDEPGDFPRPRAAAIRAAAQGHVRTGKQKQRRRVVKGSSRIQSQQKRRAALEMRKAGATYDQIAQAVGYKDGGGARKAVIKAMGDVIQEPVAELKVLQHERLNHMLVAIWTRVQSGDLAAMNMALSIMNKMDALAGTEAAQRIEVDSTSSSAVLVVEGSKDEYIAALRKMSGAGVQPDGTNAPVPGQVAAAALPAAPANRYPPGMGEQSSAVALDERTEEEQVQDIVDAVLVEESPTISGDTPDPDDGGGVGQAVPTKKSFSWDMAPKAKPRPKDQR